MTDLGVEGRLGHDYGRTLDVIVDDSRIRALAVVDVIKSVGDIGCDLHSRDPSRENCEVRVFRVSETSGKVRALNVLVDEVNVVVGE